MLPSLLALPLQQKPHEDDIYDIVVLAPKDSILPPLILGILGFFLLLALIGFGLWWFVWRNSSSPALSARRKILQKLRLLEVRENTMEPNRFSQALSNALKDYLAENYGDPVRYETTEEFLYRSSDAEASSIPQSARDELRQFLTVSEEVKFGNNANAAGLTSELFRRAHSVIELCDTVSE